MYPTNKNMIYIKNNLKNNNDLYNILKLLDKLGLLYEKKKKTKKYKSNGEDLGPDIKQSSDHMKGYTMSEPTIMRSGPSNTINPNMIEDIRRDTANKLALITDQIEKGREQQGMITTYGGILGSQLSDLRKQVAGITYPADPFKDVKGEGSVYRFAEEDEQDFTNQGSQDIPASVLKVDVSPQSNEVLEDIDIEAFPSAPKETPKEAPKEAPKTGGGGASKKKYILSDDEKIGDVILSNGLPTIPTQGKGKKKELFIAYLNNLIGPFGMFEQNQNLELQNATIAELIQRINKTLLDRYEE